MNIFIRCNLHLGKIFMYSMKSRMVMLVFFLLLGVIGYSLLSSSLKEGFEAITQWKQNGELPWDGPYSLPPTEHVPDEMFLFANNKVSPDCNISTYTSSGGGVCTTPEQLRFLNTRGGNRTMEDGF
jgi:hypothetical protein